MSVERLVRGALFGAMGGKLFADGLGAVADLLHSAGRGVDRIADVGLFLEADAARRYRNLSGVDLGQVIGHNDRFDATKDGYEPEIIATWEEDEDD